MTRAFDKELRRSITHSLGRFLAIAIISALGCGFFAGLLMTSIDMDYSADVFYDGTNASDLYVTSTLGLDDDDIASIAAIEGVAAVEGVRSTDVYVTHADARYVMRFDSLDVDAAHASDSSSGTDVQSDDASYINRPVLVEGSWPTEPGQCVIAADAVLDEPVGVGDVIEVAGSSADDALELACYEVVGLVRSPYYLMTSNFGSSSLGSGEIDTYVFVSRDAFVEDYPYTGAYVIVEGAARESYPGREYDTLVDAVAARIDAMAPELATQRLDAVKAQAQSELDDARARYEDERAQAMQQLDAAAGELAAARTRLDDASATLAGHAAKLDEAADDLARGQRQADAARALLEEKQVALDAARSEHENGLAELARAREESRQRFELAQEQVNAIADEAQRALAQDALDRERAQAEDQLRASEAQLAQVSRQLDEASTELAAGWVAYDASVRELEAGQEAYRAGEEDLASGYATMERGRLEYEDGLARYQDNRQTALSELSDAASQLDDAQAEIDAIELPELYVLDRSKNAGMAGHEADASRIDRIARVFPLIFFLVAALVTLTTMTRMVDEERMLIGTYKALGYSNARIMSKYLIYALVASGVGSVVGIIVLSQFLPQVIMQSYATIYALPVFASPIDLPIALAALGLGVGITLLATGFAVASSLRESPALLMLPRAPKPGKRILLERVGFLWKRLSFSSKVTARNIFRYKRRFFMAIIGIAGCTALLLTGLGLHDGINDIIEKQFGQIQHYNLEVRANADEEADRVAELEAAIASSPIVTETTRVASDNVIVSAAGRGTDIRAALIAPSDLARFEDFYTLRERSSHESLALVDEGAIVTEKLADELGIAVGDVIELYDQSAVGERDGDAHDVIVTGIAEFYTGNRVFMTPACYERVMGQPCDFTEIISMATAPSEERTQLANRLLDIEDVEVVTYYDEIIDTYRSMLETVNAVVWVLIIAAALLAFVVLYNLTNINITERIREIATLKVLGFTPRETNAYIFRETIMLTVIGALAGLLLGVWMEGFVVVTAEVDQMMFGRDIHITSFVIAFALTIVFSFVVSLAMMPKIKKIDMVQSLKSVD